MRSIQIPYGKGFQVLHVPEERLRAVIEPKHPEQKTPDQRSAVRQAMENPIGSPRLRELAAGRDRVLVISSDHTRPMPSRITMPLLLSEIREGNPRAEITILIATGMHRATTREEILDRFGPEIAEKERIAVHRAQAAEEMADFGVLPSGGRLLLNRMVREADLVVSEGFIEPHFFAGFSGGRKSILPGVASDRTVLYNHNAAFIRDGRARQGSLRGNPIHEDMAFAARQAGLAFILNVLLNEKKEITAAFAGDPEKAHEAGCRACAEMSRAEPAVSDIAITSNGGYPLDQNLYQSVKGMTAAEACVRQGGAVIIAAALGDGHGGEGFYRWFRDRPDAASVSRDIENIPADRTVPDQWQAQILARIMQKAECWLVSGEENRQIAEDMHFRWAPDADTALAEATALLGEHSCVTVIPDGVGVIL